MCFARMYVCVPHVCLVPTEITRGHWIPGTGVTDNWDTVVLGTEPVPLNALNRGAVTPVLNLCVLR